MKVVGVISDTHGLLRPQALEALRGSDLIVHAGDVGKPEILEALRELAPLKVVRGNVDIDEWAQELPVQELFTVEGVEIAVNHGHLPPTPAFAAARVRIVGHSHIPRLEEDGERLLLNPGSAGPRKFGRPVGVARLSIDGDRARAELIDLTDLV